MKYNLSQIMKAAWNQFRISRKWTNANDWTFSRCLRRAWAEAKEAARNADKLTRECCKVVCGSVLYLNKGVVAEAGRMGWIVSGNTYRARQELRKAGFRWDCEAHNWYTHDASVAAYFA